MFQDLRFALRMMVKTPGFTLVVVLTLAFGIALNTQIFRTVGWFFFQELPVAGADRLALIVQRRDAVINTPYGLSFPDFQDYRARTTASFDTLAAFFFQPANLSTEGKVPERIWLSLVTPDAFTRLGVPARLGRTLLPSDGEAHGGQPVAMLSHACWQARFGGDPGVVGRTVLLNGRPFTVVGVAPENFTGFALTLSMSVFLPSGAAEHLWSDGARFIDDRGLPSWRVLGRLREGATIDSANAEVRAIDRQLVEAFPDSHKGTRTYVLPESRCRPDPAVSDYSPIFAAVFTALVVLVLCIACANVTNLMVARALERQKELTMRSALGASRWRLIRQLLVESLLLAALAGVVGWFLSDWASALFARFSPQLDLPINTATGAAARDYVFAAVVSLLAGLASGLVPALRASRIDLIASLKDGGGGRLAGGRHFLRNALVVGQVTFSIVVLVSAGLFVQSLQRLRSVDIGFRPDHLLMLSFDLGLQGYSDARGRQFSRQVLEKVAAVPGVASAAFTQHVPFDYMVFLRDVWPEDAAGRLDDGVAVACSRVDGDFFGTMEIPLLRGRALLPGDDASAPPVAVVNQAFAELCWPGADAVGKRFRVWPDQPWIEVVGVTTTARYVMLAEDPRPYLYLPVQQDYFTPHTLMVRTRGDPAALARDVRAAIQELDADLPVFGIRTMNDLMEASVMALMPFRLGASLAAVQGIIGLLLAVMGLYAVVSHGVSRRTQEIGIRVALGANPRQVVKLVVRESLRLTVLGIVIGLALAVGVGVLMSRILYGLDVVNPFVVAGVTALLLATAALACYWPVRCATRVDPLVALRAE